MLTQNLGKQEYTKNDDVNLLTLDIRSMAGGDPINVMPQFVEMQIHEDMHADFVYGSLSLIDTQNLMTVVPIVINETITIEFVTPGTNSPKKFVGEIFSIDTINPSSNERAELYTLRFISKNYLSAAKRKVAGNYSGTMNEIVEKIQKRYFSPTTKFVIDKSAKEKKNYNIPFLNPIKALNWLAVRAASSDNADEVNYRFYEDEDGYHFVNICDFMDKPVKKTIFLSKTAANATTLDQHLSNLYSYQFSDVPDKIMNCHAGMFNSSLSIYDLTSKKFKYVAQDYHSFFDKTKHLNKGAIIAKSDEAFTEQTLNTRNFIVYDSQKCYCTKKDSTPSKEVENTLLKRVSLLQQLGQFRITMQLPGDSRIKVGDVYELKAVKRGELTDADPNYMDELRSGNHLVTAVKHTINKNGYRMNVEASRDSYLKPIADGVFPKPPDSTQE